MYVNFCVGEMYMREGGEGERDFGSKEKREMERIYIYRKRKFLRCYGYRFYS